MLRRLWDKASHGGSAGSIPLSDEDDGFFSSKFSKVQ